MLSVLYFLVDHRVILIVLDARVWALIFTGEIDHSFQKFGENIGRHYVETVTYMGRSRTETKSEMNWAVRVLRLADNISEIFELPDVEIGAIQTCLKWPLHQDDHAPRYPRIKCLAAAPGHPLHKNARRKYRFNCKSRPCTRTEIVFALIGTRMAPAQG
jgi:hypothetical protein